MRTGNEKQRSRATRVVATGVVALSLAACEQRLMTATNDAKACAQMRPRVAKFSVPNHDAQSGDGNVAAGASSNDDIALLLRVKSALDSEPVLSGFTIDVGVRRGVIALYGEVDTAQRRAHAVHTAQNVLGVREIKIGIDIIRRL